MRKLKQGASVLAVAAMALTLLPLLAAPAEAHTAPNLRLTNNTGAIRRVFTEGDLIFTQISSLPANTVYRVVSSTWGNGTLGDVAFTGCLDSDTYPNIADSGLFGSFNVIGARFNVNNIATTGANPNVVWVVNYTGGTPFTDCFNDFNNAGVFGDSGTSHNAFGGVYNVSRASVFSDAAGTVAQTGFGLDSTTAYVRVAGLPAGVSNWNVSWIAPNGTLVCGNFGGADRPESSPTGTLPFGGSSPTLRYPPAAGGDPWNIQSNYNSACPSFASVGQNGQWKLRLVNPANSEQQVLLDVFTTDLTRPNTTITSAPTATNGGNTTNNMATFTFTSTEGSSTFLCSLDGGPTFSCTSGGAPFPLGPLANGTHNFAVSAVDPSGNTDLTPATWTWTIVSSTTAPTTTVSFPTSGSFHSTVNTNLLPGDDPTFLAGCGTPSVSDICGTASDADGVASVQVSISQGGLCWNGSSFSAACPLWNTASGTTNWSFAIAGSGLGTAGTLASTTIQVRATDTNGNISSPISRTFTVDNESPNVFNLSGPTSTGSTNPVFTWNTTDSGGSGVNHSECSIDFGGWFACSSGNSFPMGTGSHNLRVRAVDNVGNVDQSPASANVTIQALSATVTGGPGITGPNPTSDNTPTFTFTTSPSGGTIVADCQVDGVTVALGCTSPFTTGALSNGFHTFGVRARDTSTGNAGSFTTVGFTINTNLAPTVTPITSNTITFDNNWATGSDSFGPFLTTNQQGAEISMPVTNVSRVGIQYLECNTCGSVQVWIGSTFIGTINMGDGFPAFGVQTVTLPTPSGNPMSGSLRIVYSSPASSGLTATVYGLARVN